MQKFPFPPNPCQHWFLLDFMMLVILSGVTLKVNVVFICISLMTTDVEHFFKNICTSFEKCLFVSVAHLLIDCFTMWLSSLNCYIF